MKYLAKTAFLFIMVFGVSSVFAQQTPKQIKQAAEAAALKSKIEAKRYTFIADYALPMHGGQRFLNSDYDVRVTPDSVIAYLPYFGEVHLYASMNPDDAGIKFTSTKFTYTITEKKKGGWSVYIVPSDVKEGFRFNLDIGVSGYASLQVTSISRDQISFNGHMKEDNGK